MTVMEEKKRKTEMQQDVAIVHTQKDQVMDKVRKEWEEESRLVKGIYRCHEPVGGQVTFSFKKYPWDKVVKYTFMDGETYTIPLAVARHLNNNCNYTQHTDILGPDGRPIRNPDGKKKSRMNFESLDFWNLNE